MDHAKIEQIFFDIHHVLIGVSNSVSLDGSAYATHRYDALVDSYMEVLESIYLHEQSPLEGDFYRAFLDECIKRTIFLHEGGNLCLELFDSFLEKYYKDGELIVYINSFKIESGKIRPDLVVRNREKIVVFELDSFQYHSSPKALMNDKIKERKIQALGYPVYRFSGKEIKENLYGDGGVLNDFFDILKREGLIK